MKVKDILKMKDRALITTGEGTTLLDASKLLRQHNIGVLLVVNWQGQPVGILSERDIVQRFAQDGGSIEKLHVKDVMVTDLIVGEPDDDIQYVMQVMTQRRIRHLPILGPEGVAGLVSIGDVVKAHIDEAETEIRYLRNYITGERT